MNDELTCEDVAVMIRARRISRRIGLAPDADIKTICEHAGISRKTGYQWSEKFSGGPGHDERELVRQLDQLKSEHEKLKDNFEDVRFENEGRKLAWEIHGVDELLAEKKNNTLSRKRKKR